MKVIKLVIALFCASLLCAVIKAKADDLIIRGGTRSEVDGKVKLFGIRYETSPVLGSFKWATEVGAVFDNAPQDGGLSFQYLKTGLGVTPGAQEGLFGKAFINLAGISRTDSQLGSLYQFSEDFGLGIRDRDCSIALVYTHFSNAGIKSPNRGKDYLVLELGFKIW